MLTPFDHAFALVLLVLFPARSALYGYRRLQNAAPDALAKVRVSVYRGAMITQWALAAIATGLWAWSHRPWRELGLIPLVSAGLIGVLGGLAVGAFVVVRQRISGPPDQRSIDAVRRRSAHFELLMPRTPGELRMFYLLSVTAGLCEEFLYRGWLIWYLQALGLALIPAALVSSLIFGLGHLYQGLRGIALTSLVGGFLAAVYLVSGSLYAGMLLHGLMDAYSGQLLYTVYSREDATARAIAVHTRESDA
jgi:membrane protease YdiL (CAAX protease family)